ncbi:RDD family protein [Nitratireductor sp. XY-223]|uniref:RDD family protein n=1 Tax=Nitratireductor sp. XY-223 TaxID=2561926 RepID=UPI0010A9BEA9|nr:RDD family protein [Nitratireductor sp. XY-223]
MNGVTVARNGQIENFIPPEGVPITFVLASRGARVGAQVLDIIITFGGTLAFILLLAWSGVLGLAPLMALYLLLTFFIRIPYYIFAELVWNGRTLGKRIVRIRVISADGRRLTPHQIVARNLMKEVEVFLPITTLFAAADLNTWVGIAIAVWMILVLLVPFFNRKRQRFGDMIADTLVVEMPQAVLLRDLSESPKNESSQFVFNPEHLEIYGQYELQVLESILREPPKSQEGYDRVREVSRMIIKKIGYTDPVPQIDEWKFLLEFYKQQRGFLENRHLFGDSRRDKFHADRQKNSDPDG